MNGRVGGCSVDLMDTAEMHRRAWRFEIPYVLQAVMKDSLFLPVPYFFILLLACSQ